MNGPRVDAHHEEPLFLAAGDDRIFGVLTSPSREPSGLGVLLLAGGVYVLNTNKNRMFVDMARLLGGAGHYVLRIDYRGVGESTGTIGGYALDDPNPLDVRSAMHRLLGTGVQKLVLVGTCYGARAAMHVAAEDPELAGMILFAPPIGDLDRGEAPTADRIGPLFVDRLGKLAHRRIPTSLIYGVDDAYYHDFQQAKNGPLAELFQPGSPLSVTTLPGKAHGLERVATQQAFTDFAVRFCSLRADRVQG
ncbi:alpha/beta hydrolase [Streptomyces sp. NPDC056661]|uniref:alpha/beta hydrolase n=1 Tax=Streptomyces sp. NPDC056661 TaxID=3345898 RepID=UPI003678DF6F